MGWFSSWFSSDSSRSSRRGQAISSTHEAFSLPTSSPVFASHPDISSADTLNTPDPETAVSPSFTYPPQGSSKYGYFPTSAGPSRRASLLPLHHDPLHTPSSPSTPYPPLVQTWNRLQTWLNREYPELGDTLNYGILPQDLAHMEMQFGFALPAVIRESYLVVDGQEAESAAGCSEGLFFGLTLMPLEDVLEEWRFWREVDDDPTTGANTRLRGVMQSLPPGWVRKEYSQRGWIPLITDKTGNYVGIDLNPAERGSIGQVIVFGRDFDTKVVLWNGDGPAGWAKWLASFVDDLESGEGYEIGNSNDASDGSEDDLGYESYFYDGSGRGQGDGGGDNGSGGGLRLTGEYRGWNVLEAWADRSLRKWYEAGVITDTQEVSIQDEEVESVGLGVDRTPTKGAEVHISVLADVDVPPLALGNVTNTTSRPSPLNLPSVTVTKPPAPLPVDLPTPRDIVALPSPPESIHTPYEDDLESGMREIPHELERGLVSNVRRSPQPQPPLPIVVDPEPSGSALAVTVPLPISPEDTPATNLAGRLSPPPDIPDLLADSDSTPTLVTAPIEPSTVRMDKDDISPVPEQESSTIPSTNHAPASLVDGPPSSHGHDASSKTDPETGPDVTIRLVGGGGTAGTASTLSGSSPQPEDQPVLNPTSSPEPEHVGLASVTSKDSASATQEPHSTSTPTPAEPVKKHKKTKSGFAGLKKLGHIGGMRKKDSTSSISSIKDKDKESTV